MGACAIDSRDPLVVEYCLLSACVGLPGGSAVEDPPAKSGDSSLVAGSGRSPAEGNGNSLQYSCLETIASDWHSHTHLDGHVCQKRGSVAWDYANTHNSDGDGVLCV